MDPLLLKEINSANRLGDQMGIRYPVLLGVFLQIRGIDIQNIGVFMVAFMRPQFLEGLLYCAGSVALNHWHSKH